MIEKLPPAFQGDSAAEIANQLKVAELKILIDMSKSLAIIADTLKADQKTRRSKND